MCMVAAGMRRIGRYEVLSHLATGGMGQVYLAKTTGLGGFERQVVVKTLDVEDEDDPFVTMFLDEARLVGALHHQYIAPVYEVGRDEDGRYFLVMDYVRGETAEALWKRATERGARLSLELALTVVRAIASALAYAHALEAPDGTPLEIVHRDVSLSNIMIGYEGGVKLIDFGIAKSARRATRTLAGTLKGKFGYLAPEQVLQRNIDHRADIFALGVVLYELTTMARAFVASSELLTLERITKGDVVLPSRHDPRYPRGLELIVMKALAVDPRQRFQNAQEMVREVEAFARRAGIALGDAPVADAMTTYFGSGRRLGRGSASLPEIPAATPEEIAADQELTVPLDAAAVIVSSPPPTTMTAEIATPRDDWRGFWIALVLVVVAAGVAIVLGLT
jgi:serine/threonine protein kinase